MDRARRGSQDETAMLMRDETIQIADIYVPTKRRATLNPATVEKIAESMLEEGQRTPILVRKDGDRFVLVEGLHRLEACKSLGETKIKALFVQARRS
jgi:ParB-like chromosome segregation protein Spo0J